MFCIKCNQTKNKDEMFYSKQRGMFENVCNRCKKDTVAQYQIERAISEDKKLILHLRNVLRKMVEAIDDRDSKKLRQYADVARLEISVHKIGKRSGGSSNESTAN